MNEEDEILIQETREQLRDLDLSEDEIDMQIAAMRDEGMFDITAW